MVVPLILAKMSKDILSGEIAYESSTLVPMSIGFVAALITGILACTWMIKLVKNSKLTYFAIYCIVIGLIAIGAAIF
jgi:undecaprenyl-diphosphatase